MSPVAGNANAASAATRGWFIGRFIDEPGSLANASEVEVKWGDHPAGDERTEWGSSESTTLVILLRGDFIVRFPDREFEMANEGDYVLFEPKLNHSWKAVADSLVVSVRWPSNPPSR